MDLNNKKQKSFERAVLILLIVTIAFIWGNSMLPGDASTTESGFIMTLITPFLELFVGKGNVSMHLVRKLAHFTEYFVLGAELTVYVALKSSNNENGRRWLHAAIPLGAGFIAASIDETIQIFSSERGPSFKDVMLDFAGVCTGVIIIAMLICVIDLCKAVRQENE